MSDTLGRGRDFRKILLVQHIRVVYGDVVAVDDVSFAVHAGEIVGLLGPNGASTLSVIEGLVTPLSGQAIIEGFDITRQPLHARANLGVQLQSTSFHQDLTVREIVELFAALYGVVLEANAIDNMLEGIQLLDAQHRRTRQLSGGQQQRLALLVATIHTPPLLLLDEPTTGLDPQSRRQLWERIEAMRDAGRSILLTTHSMEEAYAVCDRVVIMDHGRVLVAGVPQELVEQYKNDADVLAVARRGQVTLEDVFIGLTGRAVRA
jgi:ABC-2 type transport system ATP-binding protein